MRSFLWRLAVVGVVLIACREWVVAGNYSDASGFSFTHPDGWVPITRASLGDLSNALSPELKAWVAKNNIDLSRISVILLRRSEDDFLENMNVVVTNGQIPVGDEAVRTLTQEIPKQYQAAGAKIEDLQVQVKKIGSRDAVVTDYLSRMPGVPYQLRQRQVSFPGGGKTYIVTCTAKADTFAAHEATFNQVLANFNVPAPAAGGFDLNRVLMMAGVGGIVGGLIGVVSWIIKRFSNPAKPGDGSDGPPGSGQFQA